jgi:hypothetical protein
VDFVSLMQEYGAISRKCMYTSGRYHVGGVGPRMEGRSSDASAPMIHGMSTLPYQEDYGLQSE